MNATRYRIRAAEDRDAPAMMHLLNEIIEIGGTTAHQRPFDETGIQRAFLSAPLLISCFVAERASSLLGFQALEWSDPNWSGDDGMPEDWAIISTFVGSRQRRQGIGRALFSETLARARAVGARFIDPTIRKNNADGLRFYEGLGFVDYIERPEAYSKRFGPL
jgi:ribosomal protein S18 acetylase RimI-like enzyme